MPNPVFQNCPATPEKAVPSPLHTLGTPRSDLHNPVQFLTLPITACKPVATPEVQETSAARVDLSAAPPDTMLLSLCDPVSCLRLNFIPWRRIGGTTVIAIADLADAPEVGRMLAKSIRKPAFAQADQVTIRNAVASAYKDPLRQRALTRCAPEFSCRNWPSPRVGLLLAALAFLVGLIAFAPLIPFFLLFLWVLIANTATTVLRLSALSVHFGIWLHESHLRKPSAAPPALTPLQGAGPLPKVSILIPLLREETVVGNLIAGLEACSYPHDLLDIKLVLEADDQTTRAALADMTLPPWISILPVPVDSLRTKPRAMNYALDFCDGAVIGIYDAEDHPEPDQILKIVRHLQAAPPEVACAQGYLDFYNARRNWLARCFTIEYAIWFRVLLKGVQGLGLPIPLGGTTVFFRRAVLEKLGAWDAHNVTEDADLGMRLARFGYRCEMVNTTTMEEANCNTRSWIRQRSRWLKGYAITWATHMRSPARLYRELGLKGFLALQTIFLGAITAYLSVPLLWFLLVFNLGLGQPLLDQIPDPLRWAFFTVLALGQIVMLIVALLAVWPQPRRHLVWTVLTLPFYWPLGAIAAWLAVAELIHAPFHWHKTTHGL